MASSERVPKKYWWVVAVVVPIVVALVAIVPDLVKSFGKSAGGPSASIRGNNNRVSFDYSTHNTFVTNVAVIAGEYEAQTGRPLDDDMKRTIEQAVSAALQSNHTESVRLFEQIATAVPVPAIYNNLGVEYARTQKPQASQKAFELAKQKIAELTEVAAKNRPLPPAALRAPAVSGPGVRSEASAVPAMVIEALSRPYQQPAEVHVVRHGTPLRGSYQVSYAPTPGDTVVMDPGAYDVLMKASSYGAGFVLASNVEVREGSLTRINPNALVGGIAVEPVTRKGFPLLKDLEFVTHAAGDERLLAQQTDTLGVTLPIAPGVYDVVGTTADDQRVELASELAVKAGAITRLDTTDQLAVITVHALNVPGLQLKAVYTLKAGTNEIAAKAGAFETPMLVRAGMPYDIALEQSAGLTRIRSGIVPKRGELVDIR